MKLDTSTSPHVRNVDTVTKIMLRVIFALTPGIAAYTWFFGWGLLFNICIAITTAVACETVMLHLRQRPIKPALADCSAIVTATLLALSIPPIAPWWITVIGVIFAIAIAKHLYGGLGYNPFNPAMVGYVMLLISFPMEMTSWIAPTVTSSSSLDFLQSLIFILTGSLPPGLLLDAITEATPLDALKMHLNLGNTVGEIRAQFGLDEETSRLLSVSPIFGELGGKGWEWINAGFLAGGLWLIHKRVIGWQIPLGMLGALAFMSMVFYLYDPDSYASPLFHVFSGAAMLGAFFIATDPVTAAASPMGRLAYGIGIGIFMYVIRTWGGYPDSVAFAILLMNMVVPILDTHIKPRVFGHKHKEL